MRFRVIISLLIAIALNCSAQRTTRKGLEPRENLSAIALGDTIKSPSTDILKISGYDKPLNSHKETFFVTNNGARAIVGINITFNYFDNQNRQLHQATKTVNCTIPPGETRQLSISSWDKQKSFYYHRSAKPRRQATPYSVTHSINFVITSNP